MLEQALWRAREARLCVLEAMAAVIARPRVDLKDSAPLVEQLHVPPDLLGKLVGPAGANVRRIQALTGAHIQVAMPDEDAVGALPIVSVYAPRKAMAATKALIRTTLDEHRRISGSPLSAITPVNARVFSVGTVVDAVVTRVLEFGIIMSQVRAPLGVV